MTFTTEQECCEALVRITASARTQSEADGTIRANDPPAYVSDSNLPQYLCTTVFLPNGVSLI